MTAKWFVHRGDAEHVPFILNRRHVLEAINSCGPGDETVCVSPVHALA
jgi:hypothetical protein